MIREPNCVLKAVCGVYFSFFCIQEGKSKPAPFAEKKNAKDAAPENSIGAFGWRGV